MREIRIVRRRGVMREHETEKTHRGALTWRELDRIVLQHDERMLVLQPSPAQAIDETDGRPARASRKTVKLERVGRVGHGFAQRSEHRPGMLAVRGKILARRY